MTAAPGSERGRTARWTTSTAATSRASRGHADGFGARGLVFASICAELLASQVAGEPLPLERDLVQAVSPARFGQRVHHRDRSDM